MSMNDWVHARARRGEIKTRIFGEDEETEDAPDDDDREDTPKHPKAFAGAGTGETPREKPDMEAWIRGRIRRR